MSLTAAQQSAIAARGNVLVVAGAGTGKTHTLVERCLNCLLAERPPASLDEILMVTFTDAAAAEMRQRIRARLEEESRRDPGNPHWHEQLALFETAHIGTLHSFCLQLVRQHFYELDLDPQLAVLAQEEARLLADETLDALLQKHYAGQTPTAGAVQDLIQTQGRGSDKPIRFLVLRLHRYTQTQPDPQGWLRGQLAQFNSPDPTTWQAWLLVGIAEWRDRWLPFLEKAAPDNGIAAGCAAALRQLPASPTRSQAADAFVRITAACRECPHGKKTGWLKPLKEFLDGADFLSSLAPVGDGADPLAEDWSWVRSQMATLLQVAAEFSESFTDVKRELGMVDFHDLEQYALRLLWDSQAGQPTRIARQWRRQLRFVFVDEYQDINAAQDRIIHALSREGPEANRFLVGDVKQSIYRFRLANPYIFQGYVDGWHGERGQAIPLVDNFRSREGLLQFVNSLFGLLMRRDLGGVQYDERARLQFGAAEARSALGAAADPAPCVELHLRLKGGAGALDEGDEAGEALLSIGELEEADKEARLVALRLIELKAQKLPVWDEAAQAFRPVAWSDMAVLLRAPAGKSESYAKEFSRLDVPLQVARGGFYESTEISDLLSLLQLFDNPLQDIPVLAVLHSPLVGLTLDELATIRLAAKGPTWTALVLWQEAEKAEFKVQGPKSKVQSPESAERGPQSTVHSPQSTGEGPKSKVESPKSEEQMELGWGGETYRKVTRFLERYAHWRRLARQASLSHCLEAVLTETHYAEWLLTQPRGEQRHANVQRLLGLAQEFDQFQRQGLFRFLRFVEAQQKAETEPEVAAIEEENAVRLMSIHQSKGLEFPVVVVADLGKPFNVSDLRADIILDEVFGLCPQVKPPNTGKRYPSLPFWLARQRQYREMLGEELRLLYVAMTRARDRLVLSAGISQAQHDRLWQPEAALDPQRLTAARSYSDWLGWWFSLNCGSRTPSTLGQNGLARWQVHDDSSLAGASPEASIGAHQPASDGGPALWDELRLRLTWTYPFLPATRRPAKSSVTLLRRAAEERDEEADTRSAARGAKGKVGRVKSGAPAVEVGNAHHAFLQLLSLENAADANALKQDAERLNRNGALADADLALLDFAALAAFWESPVGGRIRAQARFVRRELAFTARFPVEELAALTGEAPEPGLQQEFVVVQGAADLAVVLPKEIWLLDFKTDALGPDDLSAKTRLYAPQLRLYAGALAQIYGRPVSEAWLYFLAAQAFASVEVGDAGSGKRGNCLQLGKDGLDFSPVNRGRV